MFGRKRRRELEAELAILREIIGFQELLRKVEARVDSLEQYNWELFDSLTSLNQEMSAMAATITTINQKIADMSSNLDKLLAGQVTQPQLDAVDAALDAVNTKIVNATVVPVTPAQ